MDEEGFADFMRRNRKSESTMKRYVGSVKTFEDYLSKHKQGRSLEEATAEDLRDFARWGGRELGNVYQHS